jgi:hypothetical protein
MRPIAHELYAGSNLSSLNENPFWIATGFIFLAIAISSGLLLRIYSGHEVPLLLHTYGLSLLAVVYFFLTMLDMIVDPL